MPQRPKYSLEGILASILFIVLIGIVMIQVLGRTPLFRGPVWTEEAARWIWVWMALIGIGEVERQDKHLRMGFLAEMLPSMVRRIIFTILDLVYLGVAAKLCWIGWQTVGRTWNASSVTLPVSNGMLYLSAFLALLLVAHRILRRIFAGRSGDIGTGDPL
ncbi:TRAP transporter small permease [Nioella ostreopsis]|uniref:TRAP transporter small permease n=1 Tax=Nioella ostreopsis TaxID=2448479 RepID=UPI001F0C6CA1|nr:TRAP transporter small permease [Nioella ostreopsis]